MGLGSGFERALADVGADAVVDLLDRLHLVGLVESGHVRFMSRLPLALHLTLARHLALALTTWSARSSAATYFSMLSTPSLRPTTTRLSTSTEIRSPSPSPRSPSRSPRSPLRSPRSPLRSPSISGSEAQRSLPSAPRWMSSLAVCEAAIAWSKLGGSPVGVRARARVRVWVRVWVRVRFRVRARARARVRVRVQATVRWRREAAIDAQGRLALAAPLEHVPEREVQLNLGGVVRNALLQQRDHLGLPRLG